MLVQSPLKVFAIKTLGTRINVMCCFGNSEMFALLSYPRTSIVLSGGSTILIAIQLNRVSFIEFPTNVQGKIYSIVYVQCCPSQHYFMEGNIMFGKQVM